VAGRGIEPSGVVGGDVDEGYGPVADAFRRNFVEHAEIGAAYAVYRDGRKVVDLWGGYRNGHTLAPWREDTMVGMFSTTKGIASAVIAVVISRGLLDLDAPVARYWPEFAAAGKEAVTVRQLLSHQAGLAAIDEPLDLDTIADLDRLAEVLARQRPAWEPGRRQGYHAITLGWYENELVRRVDPQHRSIGRFLAEELCAPLDVDFHIGLPAEVDRDRLAVFHGFPPAKMLLHLRDMRPRFVFGVMRRGSLVHRAFFNPAMLGQTQAYDRPEVQGLEIPSTGGIGEARAVARIYGSLATGGRELGLDAPTLLALETPAPAPTDGLRDLIVDLDAVYTVGYIKPTSWTHFGSVAGRAFGTPGAGGSFGFADPDVGVGSAYLPNRLGLKMYDDPRELALRDALYRNVLDEHPQGAPRRRVPPRRRRTPLPPHTDGRDPEPAA
jgi:CubicO group peptidase (beta-lactamase class C family)